LVASLLSKVLRLAENSIFDRHHTIAVLDKHLRSRPKSLLCDRRDGSSGFWAIKMAASTLAPPQAVDAVG
jgi:hypothetical protein